MNPPIKPVVQPAQPAAPPTVATAHGTGPAQTTPRVSPGTTSEERQADSAAAAKRAGIVDEFGGDPFAPSGELLRRIAISYGGNQDADVARWAEAYKAALGHGDEEVNQQRQ